MHACVDVCMWLPHACVHVMYVCNVMYAMDACMYTYMCVCMHVCMYVRIACNVCNVCNACMYV